MTPRSYSGNGGPILLVPGNGSGSLQHFWHMSLGLLFPVYSLFLDGKLEGMSPIVKSCGPVMDPVLRQALSVVLRDFSIVQPELFAFLSKTISSVGLSRWDRWSESEPELTGAGGAFDRRQMVKRIFENLAPIIERKCHCGNRNSSKKPVLLLQRSKQHEFYDPQGEAEVKGYGAGRREIANLPDCARALGRAGWDIRDYEPGQHTYSCQVDAFKNCAAVVGIRGAEFANLIWVNPETAVYMIRPNFMPPSHPPEWLISAKNIRLKLQPAEGHRPELDVADLEDFLASAGVLKKPSRWFPGAGREIFRRISRWT